MNYFLPAIEDSINISSKRSSIDPLLRIIGCRFHYISWWYSWRMVFSKWLGIFSVFLVQFLHQLLFVFANKWLKKFCWIFPFSISDPPNSNEDFLFLASDTRNGLSDWWCWALGLLSQLKRPLEFGQRVWVCFVGEREEREEKESKSNVKIVLDIISTLFAFYFR